MSCLPLMRQLLKVSLSGVLYISWILWYLSISLKSFSKCSSCKKILRSEFDWYFPFALQCRIPPFISSCFLYSNKAYQSDSINMNIKHKKQLKNLTTGVPEFPWALAESCHSTKSSRMLRAWEINFQNSMNRLLLKLIQFIFR